MSSRIFVWVLCSFLVASPLASQTSSPRQKPASGTKSSGSAASKRKPNKKRTVKASPQRSRQLKRAFVASSDLKPMARQLLSDRTPAAYAGVERFAKLHASDDGGELALLVLGQAHLLDNQFQAAVAPLAQVHARGGEVSDYADYLLATAYQGIQDRAKVADTLQNFSTRHPNSPLVRDAAVMRANVIQAAGDPAEAARTLEAVRQPVRADVEFALGRAYAAQGDNLKAAAIFNRIYCEMPLSPEAAAAAVEIQALNAKGFVAAATFDQRRTRADLLMKARRYSDAAQEYGALLQSIRSDAGQTSLQRLLQIKYAGADYRSNGRHAIDVKSQLESISPADDEADAERLYYLHEIARSSDDGDEQRKKISELMQRHPTSPWLQEALLSAGNMYLLRKDNDRALEYYSDQFKLFPEGRYSPYSHWKAAWLAFRSGKRDDAKQLFEEQISQYAGGQEIPSALYWRARLAEEDGDWNKAGSYYAALIEKYPNFYYANLARSRLKFKFDASSRDQLIEKLLQAPETQLNFSAPADSLRLQRSRLLGNGALFDFAIRELQTAAAEGEKNNVWPQIEIARVYLDMDRNDRALQTLKRAVPAYSAMELNELPRPLWEILFPRPYWSNLTRDATANGLDPFLVASLIRQESEFNPAAVSHADAYGLMQILPHVGKKLAREAKIRRFSTGDLTNPSVNLQLGTRYFRQMINEFDGQVEYALAAYNAGSDRVKDWRAASSYRDVAEFVESIPFTETREYVQAILRNANIYRALYAPALPATERASKAP